MIYLQKKCLRVISEPAGMKTTQGNHHNTTKVASGIFFFKILNCRDQLSEVKTVFLYLCL